MRLIDGDRLEDVIEDECFNYISDSDFNVGIQNGLLLARDFVQEAPTIEAEPIKHGKWIPLYPHDVPITNEYKCSVCGLGFDEDEETECVVYDTFKYCPHCGAKMDFEEVNNETN